jgi:gp32 DNA binding protein like
MANIQKYAPVDVKAARAEREELASEGQFYKLEEGRNVLRLLPPQVGMKLPWVVTHQHFVRLPGKTSPIVFNCPRRMAKRFCRLCSSAEKLRASGNPVDRDLAYERFPKRRVFCEAVDRKMPEKGPQILAFGKKIHDPLEALLLDEDAGGDFSDPGENGYDIIIERQGTSKNDTVYTVMPARKSSPLGNMEWLDMRSDLTRFLRVPSDDEIDRMLAGEDVRVRGGTEVAERGEDAGARDLNAPPERRQRRAQDDVEDVVDGGGFPE